jgi:hypothetical protein
MKNYSIINILLLTINLNFIVGLDLIDINDYSFKAIYHSESENENVLLFFNIPGEISKMVIDDEEVEPCNEYIFSNIGIHTVYVLMDISSSVSLYKMFNGVKKLESIVFTSKFNTENI